MKKGKIKNILRTLMLSLIIIVPSVVFAKATYEKGDIIDPIHYKSTDSSCTSVNCTLTNQGDIVFEKEVSKDNEEEGVYEVSLKVKGEDITKEVEGNIHDIYIAVVFDISYSMTYADNKYENATAGAKYFAKKVLEKNQNANLALVTFGKHVYKVREFDNNSNDDKDTDSVDFDNVKFPEKNKLEYATNLKGGLAEAYSMLKTQANNNDNAELYIVVIGDGQPDDVEGSVDEAKKAIEDNVEIFSIGYSLDDTPKWPSMSGRPSGEEINGKEVLQRIAGFKKDGIIYTADLINNDDENDDLAKDNFVEANVDTILKRFDKIANKITKTFYAGTGVKISDTIGDNFTYVDGSAKYMYGDDTEGNSIYPIVVPGNDNNNTIVFWLEDIIEIVQTIKFKIKINENKLKEFNETNESANVIYTDHNGNENQNITIYDTAKVFWPLPEYSYVINYYKDKAEGKPLKTINESSEYLSNIEVDEELELPILGYKYDGENMDFVLDENNKIINVIYVKDTFNYTINYYKDKAEGKPLKTINESSEYLSNIEVDEELELPNGYIYEDGEKDFVLDENNKTINVIYVKDTFNYTINYYKDSIEGEFLGKVDGEAKYLDEILVIELLKLPKGYIYESGEKDFELDEDNKIVNVIYVKDTFNYTINYYKDSIVEDNLIDSINDEARYQDIIEIEELLNLPEGYTYNGEEVELTIDVENNIVNIVYEKETYKYTVEYYFDGKLDEEKTEVISALYGTEITEVEDKSYDNYLLSKIENLPLVIDVDNNIIKVYYVESGIGGDIIEPPKTGNNNYLSLLLVLISLLIIKIK